MTVDDEVTVDGLLVLADTRFDKGASFIPGKRKAM